MREELQRARDRIAEARLELGGIEFEYFDEDLFAMLEEIYQRLGGVLDCFKDVERIERERRQAR